MATFGDAVAAAPDLAARVRATLSSTQNVVLGTIRRDGSPRLSGIDCFFGDDQLCIASNPGTLKGQDLRRDPRLSLHSIPWDSRLVRDGADDPGPGDAKVSGTARLVVGPDRVEAVRASLANDGLRQPPPQFELFAVDISSIALMHSENGQLVVDQWTPSRGVQRRVAGT
jgi:hypothetical protein